MIGLRRTPGLALLALSVLAATGARAACPVAGGPTEATALGDVIFASTSPDPLTATPSIDGSWQVAGPGGDAANVDPFTPRAYVELDCGAPGEPSCDGSHIPVDSDADGTWTVAFASGQLPPGGSPEYLHWRIAGKRGVALISNPMVGAWIFNQHDANAINPVGTSIQYSATTPELSTLPGQPTLPPVFSFNPAAADRTCHYAPTPTPTTDALGDQWCNSDRQFFDPNEQQRVADRQLQTVPAHAEFCTGASANLPSCLQAWPWVVPSENVEYAEGERYEFFWTNRAGTRLHGTLWTPAGVYLGNLNSVARQPGFTGFPTVSIAGGVISHQPMYYWAADHLARNGYVVMLYDTAGQGRSNTGGGGFAQDLQDSLDFVLSTPSSPYPHHDPLQDQMPHNPFWKLVDTDRLGIAGHSAGGSASNSVQASDFHRLRAGVIWGSGGPGTMEIPYMVQSADNDDFIAPVGSNFGQSQYDTGFDPADPQPRFVLQIKDSTHIGFSPGPFYYYTCEHIEIAQHYTLAWFDRYLKGGTAAELANAEARITTLLDPDPGDGRPAGDYYSDRSCTRYDLDADGQSRTLRNEPGSSCPAGAGQSNSPTDD